MAKLEGIVVPITVELDPIVILECLNTDCIHNSIDRAGVLCCNLKRITISDTGFCKGMDE